MEITKDEPVTPAGRLFLQPQFNQVINAVIGFKNPINVEAFKTEISNSLLVKHPRFTSLLVVDKRGKEHWRKTQIKLNDHIIIHDKIPKALLGDQSDHVDVDDEEEEERIINAILADFAVSSHLSTEKPLWEIHIVSGLKCAFFRLHHALGDGISMMSIILASCKRLHVEEEFNGEKNRGQQKNELTKKGVIEIMKIIWYTIVSVIGFIMRILWVKDETNAVSGGDGVELWPRKVATAKFRLEDMKAVKRAIPNAGKELVHGNAQASFRWVPPSPGRVKLNVDASWTGGDIATGGGVLRGPDGGWILGFAIKLKATEAAMAELRAALFGLQFMERLGYEDFDLELDALEIVKMLRSPVDFGKHILGPLLWDAAKTIETLGDVDIMYVPRRCNIIAHELAKFGRGMPSVKTLWDHIPAFVEDFFRAENGGGAVPT